jgi:hypothetical protein
MEYVMQEPILYMLSSMYCLFEMTVVRFDCVFSQIESQLFWTRGSE